MRNAAKRGAAGTESTEPEVEDDGLDEAGDSPEEGGSPGMPQARDTNHAQARITLPADMIVGSAKDQASEDAPPAKRWTVVGGPYQVVYGAMIYKLLHGREVAENTHPIALLRKQGVRLEPVQA